MINTGTKAQVWHGNAMKTSGGLIKKDLCLNKSGRIVSKKKQAAGKKLYKRMMSNPVTRKLFLNNQRSIKNRSKSMKKKSQRNSKKKSKKSKRSKKRSKSMKH